jgi:hypothetical protein
LILSDLKNLLSSQVDERCYREHPLSILQEKYHDPWQTPETFQRLKGYDCLRIFGIYLRELGADRS